MLKIKLFLQKNLPFADPGIEADAQALGKSTLAGRKRANARNDVVDQSQIRMCSVNSLSRSSSSSTISAPTPPRSPVRTAQDANESTATLPPALAAGVAELLTLKAIDRTSIATIMKSLQGSADGPLRLHLLRAALTALVTDLNTQHAPENPFAPQNNLLTQLQFKFVRGATFLPAGKAGNAGDASNDVRMAYLQDALATLVALANKEAAGQDPGLVEAMQLQSRPWADAGTLCGAIKQVLRATPKMLSPTEAWRLQVFLA